MYLEPQEKNLFIRHLIISILGGLAAGILSLADIVLRKTLRANMESITILGLLPPISFIFSLSLTQALGFGRRRKIILFSLAVLGAVPLGLVYFFNYSIPFLLFAFLCFFMSVTVISPAFSNLYKRYYRQEIIGKLFGYAVSANVVASMIGAYMTGYLLDKDSSLYSIMFPAGGVLSFITIVLLALISFEHGKDAEFHPFDMNLLLAPYKSLRKVLKEDREYAIFQRNFFCYGFAFLLLIPVLPLFFVERLHIDYQTVAEARSIIGQLGILFLSPLAGTYFDRQNPYRFTGYSFMLLGIFPTLVCLSQFFSGNYMIAVLYLGYGILSIGMTGVSLSWNLSSLYFAKNRDTSIYQGIHVTLTGLRGLISPLVGYLILLFFSYEVAFTISALVFALSSFLMLYRYYKVIKPGNIPKTA